MDGASGLTVITTFLVAALYFFVFAVLMVMVAFPGFTGIIFVPETFTIFELEDFRVIFPSVFTLVMIAIF